MAWLVLSILISLVQSGDTQVRLDEIELLQSCRISHTCISDVLVHRQLAASIGYTTLHGSLHSKTHVERVLDVVNRRHRMAQMAGRASVEFYVGLALKARGEKQTVTEEAFVIRTFRKGLGIFVSK